MKKIILGIFLMLLIFTVGSDQAAARDAVAIRVNGELRSFSPGGMIVNGRTMIPVRYIVEDPAVKGQAAWNQEQKTVTIKCSGKEFIFTIGSTRVMVNGDLKQIDTAPFIYQGRTYIPLRFLVSEAGATVGWKAVSKTVIINFNSRPKVMAYYYCGTPDLLEHSSITDVAFRWLETDAQGNLFYEYWGNDSGAVKRSQAIDAARSNGQKIHASVMLMGWDSAGRAKLHELLSSAQNRQRLINNLRTHAAQFKYDGVNIDLEGVPSQDRDNFTLFLKDLTIAMHQDSRTVSVAVPAKVAGSSWHPGFDYTGIGSVVDLVVIMAYDYSFGTPGPSAPVAWVQSVADYAASCIPAKKLLLALGAYGYDWNLETSKKTTFTQSSLDKINTKGTGIKYFFDSSNFTPCITYFDGNGDSHKVWYENQTSLSEKLAIAQEKNLAGIAFWQIKGAFSSLFPALGEV